MRKRIVRKGKRNEAGESLSCLIENSLFPCVWTMTSGFTPDRFLRIDSKPVRGQEAFGQHPQEAHGVILRAGLCRAMSWTQ